MYKWGAGTHTGHTGKHGHTDHTADEPHSHMHPNPHPQRLITVRVVCTPTAGRREELFC